MSISHKTAWIQLIIFGLLFISWGILFAVNGTIFFWKEDSAKDIVYYSCAGAFAVLFGLNLTVSLATAGRNALNDERDRLIFRTASFWAASLSLIAVMAALLAISIIYMNHNDTTISVYFPLFIVLAGASFLMFTQAVASVILYGRQLHHD